MIDKYAGLPEWLRWLLLVPLFLLGLTTLHYIFGTLLTKVGEYYVFDIVFSYFAGGAIAILLLRNKLSYMVRTIGYGLVAVWALCGILVLITLVTKVDTKYLFELFFGPFFGGAAMAFILTTFIPRAKRITGYLWLALWICFVLVAFGETVLFPENGAELNLQVLMQSLSGLAGTLMVLLSKRAGN